MRSRASRHEQGAVATLVAVLLVAGVLLGFLAISVDVGQTVLERRELQNGADAGALSLAQSCAEGNCVIDADGVVSLVNDNASDAEHSITLQCGSAGTGLPACPAGAVADITQCPPLPPGMSGVPFVEVHTQTSRDGTNFIENLFGAAAGGTATSTVDSCARAGWGPPGSATTIPITFSMCEFLDAVGNPRVYGVEVALATNYSADGDPCPDLGLNGTDAPGGFGWLTSTNCQVTLDDNGWAPGETGESGVNCLTVNEVAYLPIFDCVSNTKTLCDNTANGSHTQYHIDGFAAFYVTGWRNIPSVPDAGTPGPDAVDECKDEAQNNKRCLFGYFVDDYVDNSGTISPGGSDYGVTVVQPLG